MTPETLVIDKNFKGVGRIRKATGTTNPTLRRKMARMLDALRDDARLDLLLAIQAGSLSLMEVFAAYQAHELDKLPTAATAKPLAEAMKAWIDGLQAPEQISKKHKESLETSRRYLAARSDATINDLPDVLEGLRESLGAKHPRSFNLCLAAASRFVRAKFKRSHPLYSAVRAVETLKEPAKRKRHPLTPDELSSLFPSPESDPTDAVVWGMVITGMHAEEYWGRWHVKADRIHIAGTKRGGRVRDVPLVARPAVPRVHRRTWEDKFRERTSALTPYDLRRSYANWLESAGIPRTRRKLYMGHGATDVTDLYERHEVAAFLVEDAKKLTDFLGQAHMKAPTIRLEKTGTDESVSQ